MKIFRQLWDAYLYYLIYEKLYGIFKNLARVTAFSSSKNKGIGSPTPVKGIRRLSIVIKYRAQDHERRLGKAEFGKNQKH